MRKEIHTINKEFNQTIARIIFKEHK